ncbi:MAG: endonuclease/exonuclease/phosphatase family protein [Patescibacteria group bacterium]|nr:endonuclease/exonuclease/phosphatase family protein [Patescibacteria group bacterium]
MKLVSFNVALFETNNEELYEFILGQKPDLLCLQEVADKIDPHVNPAYISKGFIDRATQNLRYSFFGPNWEIHDFHQKNFHKKESFDFEFGGFLQSGNYIKSKFRMLKKSNVFIKYKRIKFTDWQTWPQKQPKAVQIVDIQLPNLKKLRILNYHGIWTKEKIGNKETLAACKKINDLAKEVDYPVIIVGDFNLFPDTKSMRVFKTFISLVDKYNIQTTRPKSNELSHLERNVVDYILVSKGIKVNSFEVLDTDISDHLPLILDFEA